jgi:hypothetical protein
MLEQMPTESGQPKWIEAKLGIFRKRLELTLELSIPIISTLEELPRLTDWRRREGQLWVDSSPYPAIPHNRFSRLGAKSNGFSD